MPGDVSGEAASPEDSQFSSLPPTLFPSLLAEVQSHLDLARRVVSVVAGETPAPRSLSGAGYWSLLNRKDDGIRRKLADLELLREWDEVVALRQAFMREARGAIKAATGGDRAASVKRMDRMLCLSSDLLGAIAGACFAELNNRFAEREQRLSSRYEQDLLDAAQIGEVVVRAADGKIVEADDCFLALTGYDRDSLLSQDGQRLFGMEGYQRLLGTVAQESGCRVAVAARGPEGMVRRLNVVAFPGGSAGEAVLRCFASDGNLGEGEVQQRRLLSTAVEVSREMVMITNSLQEIVYVNPAFTRLTGYPADEALGRNPRFLQGPETSQATRIAIREALSAKRPVQVEILNYAKDGRAYWVEMSITPVAASEGAVTHFVAVERDVTERRATEQAVTRLALEDHLTGLANRRAAEDRLAMEWNRAQRGNGSFAIAIADIDRFKLINDQYGHHVGDQALRHVAEVLARGLRGGDWMARWGGEEFLLCFSSQESRGARVAAERLRKLIKTNSLVLPVGTLSLTVSMGVSLFNPDHGSLDSMLAQADALLYEAKHSGRDKVVAAGQGAGRKGSVIWEGSQVQAALQERRVTPVFQPIVDLRTGAVVAEEALARIRTKDDKLVSAYNFIQAAEALHLVAAVDQTISTAALRRVDCQTGDKPVSRSQFINLSHQFLGNGEQVNMLLAKAIEIFGEAGSQAVVVEITERQGGDIPVLKKNLQPLLDFGFRLALDDFGSGYSSFLYLAELPVDFLKIEGWMVTRITQDVRVRQLVETIVNTAVKLGIATVAECVESAETAQVLCDIGVDWAQGYYFGVPSPEPVPQSI